MIGKPTAARNLDQRCHSARRRRAREKGDWTVTGGSRCAWAEHSSISNFGSPKFE
jgi:hypothetical protein